MSHDSGQTPRMTIPEFQDFKVDGRKTVVKTNCDGLCDVLVRGADDRPTAAFPGEDESGRLPDTARTAVRNGTPEGPINFKRAA